MRSTRRVRIPAGEELPTTDTTRPVERLVDRMPRFRPTSSEPFHGPLPFRDRVYRGRRNASGSGVVTVEADGVDQRLTSKVVAGFEWAMLCLGSEDLARAILVDFLGFEPSRVLVEAFTLYTIARLRYFDFELRPAQIRNALRDIGRDSGISCLRCLDERKIDGEFACPVCRPADVGPTL